MSNKQYRFDFDRYNRIGMIEAIWGEHKSVDQLEEIIVSLQAKNQIAFITRLSKEKAGILSKKFPLAEYLNLAECFVLGDYQRTKSICSPRVAILGGGTSDYKVVAEAEISLKIHGINTEIFLDIGVAGLHRLMDILELIKGNDVVIACAGMEGALPTIVAGLIPQPVIGVPVSVGYGVSSGGLSALNGMLSSCAPGLFVMNIDNGYGAAMGALRILRGLSNQDYQNTLN
tara:strand:- start:963 stop:1652 length:690 start_codon:yes stop_codon:yes gene_type:complete